MQIQSHAPLYGVDVAQLRADDLDRLLISALEQQVKTAIPRVLDIGCGAGGQSLRMAQVGAQVLGIDIQDFAAEFVSRRSQCDVNEACLQFQQGNAMQVSTLTGNQQFDFCCMQRMIHYLPFTEALQLCTYLRAVVTHSLYISVTGVDSSIGEVYPYCAQPIRERFGVLSPEGAKTFGISQPVCIYTKAEFETLLLDSGWQIEQLWESAFGNFKAVCQ